jgi:hypothetical protein
MTKFLKEIVEAYQENYADVLCGALMMNGSASSFHLYRYMSK